MKATIMRRMRIAGGLAVLCLLFSLSCKESIFTPDTEAVGTLVSYEGCKSAQERAPSEGGKSDSKNECLEYEYNGLGALCLKHINAGFNCCPGKIVADITIVDNVITLQERETEPMCHCLCLFDVNYIFENVKQGVYQIRVKGPCHTEDDELFEITLPLSTASWGTHCLERKHYPWGS